MNIINDKEKPLNAEINSIIEFAVNKIIPDMPSKEVTVELFFLSALQFNETNLLYYLSSYLNSLSFEKLNTDISNLIQNKCLSVLKPGRLIKPSQELATLLFDTFARVSEENATSFDVLVTLFMEKKEKTYLKPVADAFERVEVNINVLKNLEKKYKDRDKMNTEMSTSTPSNVSNGSKIPYCVNLSNLASRNKFDSLIGRESELQKIERVFYKKHNNNVMLVGDNGVGKTSIINGIVNMAQKGYAPAGFRNKEYFLLNVNEMMSGTSLRGMFEERTNILIKSLQKRNNVVLVMDNVHKILTARKEDDYDFPSMLSNILQNTSTKVICTTTQSGYSKYIIPKNDIDNKFQVVRIEKPTKNDCIDIIMGIKDKYEKHHKVTFSRNIIDLCVNLCDRYMTDKSLPASVFDVIDEIGALKKSERLNTEHISESRKLLKETVESKNEEEIKNKSLLLSNEIQSLDKSLSYIDVSEEDVFKAVALHTDIPINKLCVSEKEQVRNIDKTLKESIIGQDNAIDIISRAIKRSKVGLSPKNRPLGTFFLLGESGVGKTLLAKHLAKYVFGDEKYLVKFDMSEYSDKTSVNKLIGASAGYVGYDKGGLLTEAVKEKKYCVLLLDEIEKAHTEVHNLCLQLFDEGCLTDNTGYKVDFRNTIIILTSNVGTRKAAESNSLGFVSDEGLSKMSIIKKELKNQFPPEFLNRVDEIVYFNRLGDDDLRKIIRLEIEKLKKRLIENKYDIDYDESVVEYILSDIKKEDNGSGARPIIRSIQNNIESRLTDLILDNDYQDYTFSCTCNDGVLFIK